MMKLFLANEPLLYVGEREFHTEQRANADQLKNTQVFSAESLQNDVRPTLVHIVTKSVKMFGLYPP